MADYKFKVEKLPAGDVGRGRVRVHYSRRGGAPRFTVFRISKGDRPPVLTAALGHEKADDVIQMDLDPVGARR